MKKNYYLNREAQRNGDHEVHVRECEYFPENTIDLKAHDSCYSAVQEAKKYYIQVNGCYYCCNACHTQ